MTETLPVVNGWSPEEPLMTVGVVADTHVPDRAAGLNAGLLPALKALEVSQILHAGDICSAGVLKELQTVAPVTAVRGNRDWVFADSLPWMRIINLRGVAVGLIHGHGSLRDYLWDKVQYLLTGYRLERYTRLVRRYTPGAQVIVFGHTHRPINQSMDGILFFNPGSANFPPPFSKDLPGFGVLRIYPGRRVEGQLFKLCANGQFEAIINK